MPAEGSASLAGHLKNAMAVVQTLTFATVLKNLK